MTSKDQELFIGKNDTQIDSMFNAGHFSGNKFERFIFHQFAHLINSGVEGYMHLMIRIFSYAMFLLMPFFAYLLYLFNRKSFYIDNLIFSIHFHSFLFFVMTLYFLSTLIYQGPILLGLIIIILGVIYLHKAIKISFPDLKRSYFRTIILSCLYMFFLICVNATVVILSIVLY
jgi:hypothetical protein